MAISDSTATLLTEREKCIRAAAYVETEGDICLYKTQSRGNVQYVVRVRMTSTTPELLEWMRQEFGGAALRLKKRRGNERPCWDWNVKFQKAEDLLRRIEPFLLVKRDRARCCLELRSLQKAHAYGLSLTERCALYEPFLQRMKAL